MTVGPTQSPFVTTRGRVDAELKKALSVLNPNDFSSNVRVFDDFIDSVRVLFNEEAAELLRNGLDLAKFKREVRRLREQIIDEYTDDPTSRKLTKGLRKRMERPMDIDERMSVVSTDKWDLCAPTGMLPNKKGAVRDELKRVLGGQLPYWFSEAARRFRSAASSAAHTRSKASRVREGSLMAVFESRIVTVVRNASTATETRREIRMGGDNIRKALFHLDDRVIPGEEVHCEIFDEPRVVTRVNPCLVSDGVAYWEAEIMPLSQWNHLNGRSQLAQFGEFNPPVLAADLHRSEFPKHMYHAQLDPVMAHNQDEEVSARAHGYGDLYIPRPFPKVKYHWTQNPVTVKSAEEEEALGGGWADTPVAFQPYNRPRGRTSEHDATKWVERWAVPGLDADIRRGIKAQIIRADASFWRAADASSSEVNAMRQAFTGVAKLLSEGGILTEGILKAELPQFIWDCAIAGGWYRYASEMPNPIFPVQIGHYWLWRHENSEWKDLFYAESGEWLAWLLENPHEMTMKMIEPPAYPTERDVPRDEAISPGREPAANAPDDRRAPPAATAPYPKRGAWLEQELALRGWNVHDLQAQGGPDWKTSRKILDGLLVSRGVLEKISVALSKKNKRVLFGDIPEN
jgi:hypothetical protein